jgi:GntR family transcriptional repressor for pyruvate dehydrogenase complex
MAEVVDDRPELARDELFAPIRPVNAFEQLVERLGRAIRLGLLRPGERLPAERRLADELELSRSTVREALRVLYEAGYLEARRGRGGGIFVARELPDAQAADPSHIVAGADDLHDLVGYRRCLELGSVELATGRIGRGEHERLAALIDEAGAAGRPETYGAYRSADSRFHIGLARAGGSARLVEQVIGVQEACGALLAHLPHSRAALRNSNEQHRRILAAVEAGDPEAGRAAMREHLEGTERLLQGILPATAAGRARAGLRPS